MSELHILDLAKQARDEARLALETAAPLELKVWKLAQYARERAEGLFFTVRNIVESIEESTHGKKEWEKAFKAATTACEAAEKAENTAKEKLMAAAGDTFDAWEKAKHAWHEVDHAYAIKSLDIT